MTVPTADFVLPGRWWRVPLESESAIRSSVKRLALEVFGRADDRARLRADFAADLTGAARRARAGDGQDFFFAQELAPGEHVPMSLTTFFPVMDQVPSRSAAPSLAARAFTAQLLAAGEEDVMTIEGSDLAVVRASRATAGSDDGLGRITMDYWVLHPTSPRALVMSFTTPLVDVVEELALLSEAIVMTVQWRAEPQQDSVPS